MSKSIKRAVMDTSGKIHIEYNPEPSKVDIIKISELLPSKVQTEDQARIEALETEIKLLKVRVEALEDENRMKWSIEDE